MKHHAFCLSRFHASICISSWGCSMVQQLKHIEGIETYWNAKIEPNPQPQALQFPNATKAKPGIIIGPGASIASQSSRQGAKQKSNFERLCQCITTFPSGFTQDITVYLTCSAMFYRILQNLHSLIAVGRKYHNSNPFWASLLLGTRVPKRLLRSSTKALLDQCSVQHGQHGHIKMGQNLAVAWQILIMLLLPWNQWVYDSLWFCLNDVQCKVPTDRMQPC